MKSILEGREELKAVVYQIAEVTGYLWQKGWAERNGGNITVNVTEYMDDECKAMKAIHEGYFGSEADRHGIAPTEGKVFLLQGDRQAHA